MSIMDLPDSELGKKVKVSLARKTRRLLLMQGKYGLKNSEIFKEFIRAYKEINKFPDGLVVLQLEYLVKQLERHERLIDAQLGVSEKIDE